MENRLILIRRKKLGAILYDSRRVSCRSLEECARILEISPEQYSQFERGEASPTLPQVELLSLYLNIPVDVFWDNKPISAERQAEVPQNIHTVLKLRNRIIAASLRLARQEKGISTSQLAEKTGIEEELLFSYENGNREIPLPELETLAEVLDVPISQFLDEKGPIAKRRIQRQWVEQFEKLPEEMQQFIVQPVNRPYLELAMRLSALDANKLRLIAESLLEITY
ncbi:MULTISPECIES: helix-turn-helix domain-containing protein [Anaerolinea]|uniref:helix-turn-helix domain-containing protein n=1 Tax=Anaerolinea TaxID=233189 RepID=UPI00261E013A|nr:helix-turn-helix transcriptional regulator [Anaerolinea thermophila]